MTPSQKNASSIAAIPEKVPAINETNGGVTT